MYNCYNFQSFSLNAIISNFTVSQLNCFILYSPPSGIFIWLFFYPFSLFHFGNHHHHHGHRHLEHSQTGQPPTYTRTCYSVVLCWPAIPIILRFVSVLDLSTLKRWSHFIALLPISTLIAPTSLDFPTEDRQPFTQAPALLYAVKGTMICYSCWVKRERRMPWLVN